MRRSGGLAVAVGLVLLLDTLRVWLPSVIFVYGRAGITPALEMGGFGLVPFLLALVAAAALVVWRPPQLAVAGMAVMAGARVALQAAGGGDAQLWLATIGLVAGLLWLVAVAGGAVASRTAAVGLAGGMAADAAVHALLRSTGLAWRTGAGWWVAVLVLAAAAALLTWQAEAEASPAPAVGRGWLAVGPALLLHALIAGMPSRAHSITGWPEPAAVALVAGGWALALAAVWWAAARADVAGPAGAVLLLLGAGAAVSQPVWLVAVGHVLLPVGLVVVVCAALSPPGRAGPVRRGLWAAAGLVLFGLATFGYYAAYDLVLPPRRVPVAAAALVAGVVAVTLRSSRSAPQRPPAWAAAGVALALVAVVGGVAVAADPPATEPGGGFPVRVLLYNLQMGFDVSGRQSVDEQARVIAAEQPDIVVLNEVSRGWLINAATDTLPRLAEQVGLAWWFAPAADRVWGNALLSRYPLREVRSGFLPHEPAPMRRGYISAVVDLGGGAELGIVGTHLTHTAEGADVRAEQLRVVAQEARRLSAAGRPVAVLGDLNAQPGAAELEPLAEWLVDVSEPWQPVATWPSAEPGLHIDHIYVSPQLSARAYAVPETTASDHLPVAVTLTLTLSLSRP